MAVAPSLHSIQAEVLASRHCNSGYQEGDRFLLDVDGEFIAKLCPKRLRVYLIFQLVVPVALINERLSEGQEPNGFHFLCVMNCLGVGVECLGYGQVRLRISVVLRTSPESRP
ncbi:hypothetical protein DFAR_750018 [Desulfarculales bacterium]